MGNDNYHESVMVREVYDALHLNNLALRKNGKLYIDATVGTGGHSLEIIKAGGCVLGIDLDEAMLEVAKRRLEETGGSFKLVHGNFKDIDKIAKEYGFTSCNGVLFDLGVSNIHLLGADRGFSFQNTETPIDMRLDRCSQAVTAADLLNGLRKDQLTFLFGKVVTNFNARKLAQKVTSYRETKKIVTVGDFLASIRGVKGKPGLNPATLPFLALRMAVNSELENLAEALPKAWLLLKKGGRLVVIYFHSGENIVLKDFEKKIEACGELGTFSDPIVPTVSEINANARARSAKLRVFLKN